MATKPHYFFDEAGVLVSTEQVEIPDEEARHDTIDTALRQALATLQAIIDTPQAAFGNIAGAQTAVRALQVQVKDEARILRRLIRLAVNDFSGDS